MKKYRSFYILLITILTLSACTPATPAPPSIGTIVAATHAAAQAQTAAALPTATLILPSPVRRRATSTLLPTATLFVFSSSTPRATSTPTATATATNVTSGSGTVLYSCDILGLSPKNGFEVKPNEKFKWIWSVRNIGTVRWVSEDTIAKYVSGATYHIEKEVPLQSSVNLGKTGQFIIRMKAPSTPGTYTTLWSMRKGIHDFCYAKLVIIVKK